MKLPTVKQLVRAQAKLVRYRDGNLWYQILWSQDDFSFGGIFDFPVAVSDTGDAEFGSNEKGIYLMRWIRKHIEFLTEAQDTE